MLLKSPVDLLRQVRAGVDRVVTWPIHARRRLAGLTLAATDTEWRVGAGPLVTGPAIALLLLLTGRIVPATDALQGTRPRCPHTCGASLTNVRTGPTG